LSRFLDSPLYLKIKLKSSKKVKNLIIYREFGRFPEKNLFNFEEFALL
jgi:hypothetical protein